MELSNILSYISPFFESMSSEVSFIYLLYLFCGRKCEKPQKNGNLQLLYRSSQHPPAFYFSHDGNACDYSGLYYRRAFQQGARQSL